MYIFVSSELSKDEMTKITDPQICGELPSLKIYLSWSEMAWKFVGEITVYNVTIREVCPASDYSVTINFPSKCQIFIRFLCFVSERPCQFLFSRGPLHG